MPVVDVGHGYGGERNEARDCMAPLNLGARPDEIEVRRDSHGYAVAEDRDEFAAISRTLGRREIAVA